LCSMACAKLVGQGLDLLRLVVASLDTDALEIDRAVAVDELVDAGRLKQINGNLALAVDFPVSS
jgi:hypothetical protein